MKFRGLSKKKKTPSTTASNEKPSKIPLPNQKTRTKEESSNDKTETRRPVNQKSRGQQQQQPTSNEKSKSNKSDRSQKHDSKTEKHGSKPELSDVKSRSKYARAFKIETKKRTCNNEEKIHVEKQAIKSKPVVEEKEEFVVDESPFHLSHLPRFDRSRAERASITSIERVSNSPLRTNKVYAKAPSPSLSNKESSTPKSTDDFLDSPFSSKPSDPFKDVRIGSKSKRSAASLGFVEEGSREDLLNDEESSCPTSIENDQLDLLNETIDEPSFDDGYHTLRTERSDPWSNLSKEDPWSSFETETLNANNNAITKLKSTPNLTIDEDIEKSDFDDESIDFIDKKRISAIKRRSKNARYSVYQPMDTKNSIDTFDSFSLGNKFASETTLTKIQPVSARNSGTIDRRRRSKDINRSMTLYWDGAMDTPTNPENLVFNVSMNAKIQTSSFQDTILHSAATNGNVDIARFYVESDQYLNAQNGFRNTPLHCAILGRKMDIIDILLTKNLDLSIQNIDGDTALHLAVRSNMVDLVAKLVARDMKNINLQNKDGDTVLHISIWQMNEKIVELLICDELNIDIQNNSMDTPLHLSDKLNSQLKSRILEQAFKGPIGKHDHDHVISSDQSKDSLGEGSQSARSMDNDKCIGNITNNKAETLLHIFAAQNEKDLLEKILSLRCTKTKLRNCNSETALHVAVRNSSIDLIEPLIREDLELLNMADSNGDTILHYAIRAKNVELTEKLIKLGIDLNRCNKLAQSPLHLSISVENTAILRLLLKKNANLWVQDNNGCYPVHYIAKTRNTEILQSFAELFSIQPITSQHRRNDVIPLQSDVINIMDMLDKEGNSPLHTSVIENNVPFFKLFVRNDRTHLTSQNKNGDTVLHLLARYNRNRFLDFLDLSHVNTNVLNNKGQTPWNIALSREYSDVAMFLLQNKWNLSMDI
eukprot:TCONS_00006912-protein